MQARGVGCGGFLYPQVRSPRCVGLLYLQVRGLGVSAGGYGQRYFSKWASFRPGVYGIEGAAGIWGLCCNEWRNLTYAAVNDAFIRHRGSDSFVPKIHSKGGRKILNWPRKAEPYGKVFRFPLKGESGKPMANS